MKKTLDIIFLFPYAIIISIISICLAFTLYKKGTLGLVFIFDPKVVLLNEFPKFSAFYNKIKPFKYYISIAFWIIILLILIIRA